MPLHRIFSPAGTFSAEDKTAISQRLTKYYTDAGLPAFYVIVIFIDLPEGSMYIGGKVAKNFVRIVSAQLARVVPRERWSKNLDGLEACWAPYIKDRGLDWELHIEQHERDLWGENGIDPPLGGSEEEKLWIKENRPVPFKK